MITSASNSYAIRISTPQQGTGFPEVLAMINQLEGRVGAIDIVNTDDGQITRDITIETQNEQHAQQIYNALEKIQSVGLRHMSDRTFKLHLGGKIEVVG